MKAIVTIVILAAVGAGAYFMFLKPVEVPELTLLDADGGKVTSTAIRGDAELLLLGFFMPNDRLSKFSAELLAEHYGQHTGVQMAGLVFSVGKVATKMEQDLGTPFTMYSLRDAPDPIAVNQLIEAVGVSHGTRSAIISGTILAIDAENMLVFMLNKDSVKELPDRLDDAGF
jgi:hypothetical protein